MILPIAGRDRTEGSRRLRSRPSRLVLALILFAASLALAAAGSAQSGSSDPGSAAPEGQEGYPDATPAESKEIFEDEFSPTVDSLEAQAQPLASEDVLEYRGDHIALVAPSSTYAPGRPQGEPTPEMFDGSRKASPTGPAAQTPSLVLSDTPLRATADTGAKQPLDLTLQQAEGSFKATNPLVEFDGSPDPSVGVAIGEGDERVEIAAASAASSVPDGTRISDLGVFYPDIVTDTDLVISPIPGGLEAFTQVRSPQAPERVELAIGLPAGAVLLATPQGGARIVAGAEQIGAVAPPSAVDAAGVAVEVSMTVEGQHLVLTTSHHGEDLSYPLLVDPVVDVFDTWGGTQALPWRRYPADSDTPSSNPLWYTYKRNPGNPCPPTGSCWQNGLYVHGKSGAYFGPTSYAGFTYSPPRYIAAGLPGSPNTTAWINKATFSPVQYRLNGDSANSSSSAPRLKVGIFEDRGASEAPRGIGSPYGGSPITKDNTYNSLYDGPLVAFNTSNGTEAGDLNGGDRAGQQVWFQLATHVARTTQALHEAFLGGAQIRLSDAEAPGAAADDPTNNNPVAQTPWLKGTAARTITIKGNDRATAAGPGGLGIKSVSAQIFKPGTQAASSTLAPAPAMQIVCDGTHALPCAVEDSRPITYQTSQLPDGISYGWGYASDALDKNQGFGGIGAWYIKVDREAPPQPSVSGGLLTPGGTGNDVIVQASDGAPGGRDPGSATDRAAWRAGVKRIDLFIDEAASPSDSETFACTDALETCSQSKSATLTPTGASEGDHTCKFVVTDGADNPSQPLIKPCYVDISPPDTTITSGPSGPTNDQNPTFAYTSSRSNSTFSCRLDGPGVSSDSLPQGTEEGCSPLPKSYGPLADGYYKFSVKAKRKGMEDQSPASRSFTLDTAPPDTTITSGPSGLTNNPAPSFGFSSSEANSTFQCRLTQTAPTSSTPAWGSCATPKAYASLSDGSYSFEVKAKDAATNEDQSPASRNFTVDTTRPETTITSGPAGRTRNVAPIFEFESNEANSSFECRIDADPFASCDSPQLTGPFLDGEHTYAVKATDPAGNVDLTPATRTFTIDSTLGDSPEPDKLGLEQYFHYDSTETGLAGAHANLATGNLVWHRVPMVNPGRGLSSFLNLTYNSYGYPIGGDLPPIEDNRFDAEYDEFGIGFSASISGVTRINEPLGGAIKLAAPVPTVPNEIALTDPDGTRHVFTLNENESTGVPESLQDEVDPANVALVYDAPPGVDLRLRTYSAAAEDAVGGQILPEQRKQFWAMTRPDGVTYFFDGWGFLRSIKDRDGNELRYIYEHVIPATGNDCTRLVEPVPSATTVTDAGCEPRLAKVVDAAGNDGSAPVAERTISIDYFDAADLGIDASRLLEPAYLSGLANDVLHRLGKVRMVTDHAGRNLQFIYDDRGMLQSFSESAGTEAQPSQRRETDFEYSQDQLDLTDWPQLSKITDPRGNSTTITYKPNSYLPGTTDPLEDAGGERPKRRVATITNRADNKRIYTYGEPDPTKPEERQDTETEADEEDADSDSLAVVKDARGEIWRTKLDPTDRPIELTDPLGIRTDLSWSSPGDDDDSFDNGNHVLSQTVAANNPDEDATTTFTYNANGQLLAQTDPEGRKTSLSYCDHPGVYRAEGLATATNPPATEGVDQDGTFVSDLTAMQRPREGSIWRYEIDGIARGSGSEADYCATLKGPNPEPRTLPGHQTAQIDPMGVRAETSFNGDGLITEEVMDPGTGDSLDLKTTYGPFDANGLPQKVVDPEGNDGEPGDGASEHTWLYYYDTVGNLEHVVDPRGTQGLSPETSPGRSDPFTTTLQYDQLNRLEEERTPKDSEDGVFIERRYTYDLNDNQEDSFDGEDQKTTTTYTPMDRPEASTDAEGSKTAYEYDAEQSLIQIVAPRGVATAIEGDYTTRFHLDDAGRRIATEQLSTDEEDLLTSYDLDDRGNVVGVALPRDNTSAGTTDSLQSALANAAGGDRRFAMEYSPADNLLVQVEDPGGLNLRSEFVYDRNDNQVQAIEPRGFTEGDPSAFTTLTTYDARDQVTDTIDPLGGHSRYVRRADGLVTEQISPRGMETSTEGDFTTAYGYDANGNLTSRSIPYASGQYGLSDAELATWKVTYERNAVGDPVSITDATGNLADFKSGSDGYSQNDVAAHTFTNAFFDNGALQATERPSWWQLDWSAASRHESPDPGQRYAQADAGLAPDLAVPQGGPVLGESPGPAASGAEMAGMAPGPSDLPQAAASGDFASVEPEPLPDLLPRAGDATFTYDKEMRLLQVRDEAEKSRSLAYDDVGRIEEKSWDFAAGAPIRHTYAYDPDGNLKSFTDGEGNAPATMADPAYRWDFAYDQFARRLSEEAPGSKENPDGDVNRELTEFTYDPNGNLTQRITPRMEDGHNLAYEFGYDEADRLTSETNPADETWSYEFDAGGNLTAETSPFGSVADNRSPVPNRTEIAYDPMGRQIEVTEAAGGEWFDDDDQSQRIPLEQTTTMTYDADGNLIRTDAPGAVPDPGFGAQRRITETTYDGRGLPWQSSVGVGTEAARTTVQEFDPNGNLRRTVNPKGVDPDGLPLVEDPGYASAAGGEADDAAFHATVGVYDANDQMSTLHMPWSAERPWTEGEQAFELQEGELDEGTGEVQNIDQAARNDERYTRDYGYDDRGRLITITSPHLPGDQVDAVSYDYLDTGWIKTQTDPGYTEEGEGPQDPLKRIHGRDVSYGYDRRGIQTSWLTDSYARRQDGSAITGRKITRAIYPSGLLQSRTGEKPDPTDPGEEVRRRYTYFYNPSGSLVRTDDKLPSELIERAGFDPGEEPALERNTFIERDLAERQIRVKEAWREGRDTLFDYNPDGTVSERRTDGELVAPSAPGGNGSCSSRQLEGCTYDGGKSTEFTYDALGRERIMEVSGNGPERTALSDYYGSGDLREKLRWSSDDGGANEQVEESYFWRADGLISRMQISRDDSADDKDQPYAYDLNGNRTSDERGTHVFNARDQLVIWRRGPEQKVEPGSLVSYELNGSGAIQTQKDSGADQPPTTTFDYLGQSERLEWVEVPSFSIDGEEVKGSRSYYLYDDLGNVVQVQTKEEMGEEPGSGQYPNPDEISEEGPCDAASWSEQDSAADTVFYCYDEFERMITSQGSDPDGQSGSKEPEQNSYIYDGLDRRDLSVTKDGRPREHYYVGMSELLSQEQTSGGSGANDSYDYDSQGSRQGQGTTDSSGTRYHGYSKDANGSIETIEDEDGAVADDDRYVYDPYGELEDGDASDAQSAEDELGEVAQDNPFRFESHYYDSGIESYDMQAREYRPDAGRFLSQDRFAAAAGDLALQSDPLTQNRYAFAGGNPVSMIEFDGHVSCAHPGSETCASRRQSFRRADWDGDGMRNINEFRNGQPFRPGRRSPYPNGRERRQDIQEAKRRTLLDTLSPLNNRPYIPPGTAVADGVPPLEKGNIVDALDGAVKGYTGVGIPFVGNTNTVQYQGERGVFEAASYATLAAGGKQVLARAGEGFIKSFDDDAVRALDDDATRLSDDGATTARRAANGPCSFSGSTRVLVPGGRRAIRKLRIGDRVLASEPETGELKTRLVSHVWVHRDSLVRLSYGRQSVLTTDDHPFWSIDDHAWLPAGALEARDRVAAVNGTARISDVSPAKLGRVRAYNLTVKGLHVYYVGKPSLLVHNVCPLGSAGMAGKEVGHTFDRHGQYADVYQLSREAAAIGKPQGQWIDDAAAEDLIASHLDELSQGPITVEIPPGLGRAIQPDGSIVPATHATLVPSGSGVKTAYPRVGVPPG